MIKIVLCDWYWQICLLHNRWWCMFSNAKIHIKQENCTGYILPVHIASNACRKFKITRYYQHSSFPKWVKITHISPPWIWKGVSATWQSGRYTVLFPKGHLSNLTPDVYNSYWLIHITKSSIWQNNVFLRIDFKPLSPHDALKHHFKSLKTDLIILQPRVLERNFHKTNLPIHGNFLEFLNHIKSSSSTTSRELRQQFATCSG